MSQIIDEIFAEVCLDERVSDGIFRMDEESHMNALRDHLVSRGLTTEDAIQVSNRMLEGQYPERQAYRKEDGILVTWPSVKHKHLAMKKAPGKYVEEDEAEKLGLIKKKDKEPSPEPPPAMNKPDLSKTSTATPPAAEVAPEPDPKSVNQGGQMLAIEPPRGPEKPTPAPPPPTPLVQPPTTPERKAAEKAVVQQMIATDDSALTSQTLSPLSENVDMKNNMKLISDIVQILSTSSSTKLQEVYSYITSNSN